MPNNTTRAGITGIKSALARTNNEGRAVRRAAVAAAKAARNAGGVPMFNPRAHVRLMNINARPVRQPSQDQLKTMVSEGNVNLRPANSFTGESFQGRLSPEEIKQIKLLGLPVQRRQYLTEEEEQTLAAIAAENEANRQATKAASTPNGWTVTGARYLYPRPHTKANRHIRNLHRQVALVTTRPQSEELSQLDAAVRLKRLQGDHRGADQLKSRANEIRAETGYVVIEPSARSLQNAEAYHQFAEQIHDKQLRPGLFNSCFGGSCDAVPPSTLTLRNQLSSSAGGSSAGGRSRRTRKMRKSRNKRRSRKH